MSETYWDPSAKAGAKDNISNWSEHFTPYDADLTRGRYLRVSNELRDKCPVAHSDAHEDGFWVLTRYKDIEHVHLHPEDFSSFPVTVPPFGNIRPMIPLESDPPLHKKYREIINPYFSRRAQNAKAEQYRQFADSCINSFIDRGECDIARELCVPLPLYVIMEALGVPEPDRPKMENISNRLLRKPGQFEDPKETEKIVLGAAVELYEYFTQLIELRRREPGDDVVSILCQAEIDGTALTHSEILDFCMILVPAGFETTASSMGYTFLFLAEHPDVVDRLQREPELIPSAIEEILRYTSPVRGLSRTVMTETEIGGRTLHRGDRLNLNWPAANWDPEVFEEPDKCIIDRRPNRHMSFGHGSHLCLGIHMARVELKVAFEEALRRMTNIRLVDPSQVVEAPGTTWGIMSLPITFDKVPEA